MLRRCRPHRVRGQRGAGCLRQGASCGNHEQPHRANTCRTPSEGPPGHLARASERAGEHSGGSRGWSRLLRLPHPTRTESGSRCRGEANHGRCNRHLFPNRPGRAAGRRDLVLAVRHSPDPGPDDARRGQRVRRHPVVLPGHPCLRRTVDASPAQARAAGAGPPGSAIPAPSTRTAKPAAPGAARPAAVPQARSAIMNGQSPCAGSTKELSGGYRSGSFRRCS